MLFNTLQFLFFFVIVTSTYFLLPYRYRWFLLLAASCYFYMSFIPKYILILGFTIVIDYFAGIFLEKIRGPKRKVFLIFSLIANIGVLAIFKYYNFINENLFILLRNFSYSDPLPALSIILPIGLSFHTFQAMSYTIEVYRGTQKAEKNFGIYALYVMFYPQLVAGPIERPQNLLHQFYEKHEFSYPLFKIGITQILFGLFKKVVIADRLSIAVDHAYLNVAEQSGLSLALATVMYAFQIYCDFSGYSDIAIGSARVMGFKLMTNFNSPYLSKSIAEFWKRWHISLSTWFKDYLYIPLGGNRVGMFRWFFNLFIVFVISGIWHGANWTFLIWGAIHGVYLIFGILKDKLINHFHLSLLKSKYLKIPNILITFFLASFAWIFFRAENFNHAVEIINKILHLHLGDKIDLALNNIEILFSFFLILILVIKERYFNVINTSKNHLFLTINTIVLVLCYFLGVFNQSQFIYFQF